MENRINRITDILRRDDGISGAMHYTEQISWILFLKFLNDLEETKNEDAELDGEIYNYIIDPKYRWGVWAVPKKDRKKDLINSMSGEDLLDFVNKELFPYLTSFKSLTENPKSIKYKIGAIFEYLDNRIANGHTLREVLDIIDDMDFHSQSDLFQLSLIYEKLLKDMGSDGGNSGEFYTPRPLIKVIVDVVNPQIGQTIYDPSVGSCGFLIDAYNHIRYKDVENNIQNELSVEQLKFLNEDTFFGNEKTPLSYVMGVMNMILHQIQSPNISKTNTLTKDIRGLEEKDRYDCILANASKYINEFTDTYSEFGLAQSKLWKKGTICMTIAANIGDVAILGMDSCFPDSVVGIYSENNSNDYLYYFLLTLKRHLESKATTTAQMNINLKVLQTIGVPLPSFSVQQKVVTYLDDLSDKIERVKTVQKEKMDSLKALKASILDKAFRGEL